MRSPRLQIIGIEANQLSGAVFRRTKGGGLQLLRSATVAVQVSPSAAVAALAAALELSGAIEFVLPGHLTLAKNVKTPSIAQAKCGKIADFEASQCIPTGMGEVVWDYAVVAHDAVTLEMMIVAAKSETIATWCGAAAAAGLSVERVTPASLAVYWDFQFNHAERTDPVVLVSVKAKSTEMMLIGGGKNFFRTLALGDVSLSAESPLDRATPDALGKAAAFRLTNEVAKCVAQIRIQTGVEPTAVVLSAASSLIAPLSSLFAGVLTLPVQTYDSLRRVAISTVPASADASASMHSLAPLVGVAAMHTTDRRGLRMNLLPKEVREERAIRRRQPWWLAAAALFVASVLPAVWHFRVEAAAGRSAVAAARARLSTVRELAQRNDENLQRLAIAQKTMEIWQRWSDRRSAWREFLADLQSRIAGVDDVWLERLEVFAPTIDHGEPPGVAMPVRIGVAGCLLDRRNPPTAASAWIGERVRQLIGNLAQSRFVARVEDEHFEHSKPGLLRFQFTLVAASEAPL